VLTIQAKALRKAVAIAGSDVALATRLGISVTKLRWMEKGLARVPDEVFCHVVDILADESISQLARAPLIPDSLDVGPSKPGQA
jgi:DNA-binding transcriptional regulator YdaS (Cro superfamily)